MCQINTGPGSVEKFSTAVWLMQMLKILSEPSLFSAVVASAILTKEKFGINENKQNGPSKERAVCVKYHLIAMVPISMVIVHPVSSAA